MRKKYAGLVVMLILILGDPAPPVRADDRGGNDAVVSVLQGTAWIYRYGDAKGRRLKKGDTIQKDRQVKVAEKSRLEMRFPDGTVMRLSERSHIKMSELSFNEKTESKNVKVSLALGKLWAKVKKLAAPDSSVEVQTSNAVAGVRGTVYRVNVEEDTSALVKVYEGTVYVANPPKDASTPDVRAAVPHQVPGPNEVPPPYHEVSREEWTAIVTAMQQITISPQGVPSKPRDFEPKADQDDWVRWNQQRDREIAF